MAETGLLRSPGGALHDHEGAGGPMAGSGDPRVPGGRAAGQEQGKAGDDQLIYDKNATVYKGMIT